MRRWFAMPPLRSVRAAWVLAVLSAGCRPSPPAPAPPDSPEEKVVQVTAWGQRFEAFVEFRRPVAGGPTTFAAHLTDLSTFEPLKQGAVKFVLTPPAGGRLEHVEQAPARPGIYTPRLTFPSPGEWSFELRIPVDGGESVVSLPAVTVYPSAAEAARAPETVPPEGISFLKEQQWKLGTKIEPASRRRLVERLQVPGRVAVRPGSRAAVTPPLSGRLLAPPGGALPGLGARVRAGETLALIQPPFSDFLGKLVEAEAGVVRARLALELAELTQARVTRLADQQLKSGREREEADFGLRTAKAGHEAALALQAAYRSSGMVLLAPPGGGDGAKVPGMALTAPISGVVIEIGGTLGEHLTEDRAAFTILDADSVFIEARIPEADLARVASPAGAQYELPGEEGRLHPVSGEGGGRAVFTGPAVDPSTRTAPLWYEVRNEGGRLRIGMSLTVQLETRRVEEAVAVPESALVDEEAGPVVFIQVSGETFEKRPVIAGIRDGEFAEITRGLEAGERVATRQAYAIRLASLATSLPAHGHEH